MNFIPKTLTDYDKLTNQVKFILDKVGKDVKKLFDANSVGSSDYDNEYGPHTLLKLAYLNYYLRIFTRIAKSRKDKNGFSKILFIDAFAGSGLVNIRGTKYAALGSSTLAALNGNFDEIISFEINQNKAELLSKRLDLLSPGKTTVISGDVNSEIERIVKEHVSPRTIVLFFVDPEGMEPEFSKLKVLIDRTRYVDIIMNYTWGIYRLQGRIEKKFADADISRMRSFLPEYEPGHPPDEALLKLFENQFGKPYGNRIEIKSTANKIEYSMILRVRENSGKNNENHAVWYRQECL